MREPVVIDPAKADIRVEVAPDGVFIGFYTGDGRVGLLNLDKLSASGGVSYMSAEAVAQWTKDRRDQAAAMAG
jgi:hypothetical protein